MAQLSGNQKKRLEQINRVLYPMRIRYLPSRGTFMLRRQVALMRRQKTLGTNLEQAYQIALQIREADAAGGGLPLVTTREIWTLADWWAHVRDEKVGKWAPKTLISYEASWAHVPDDLAAIRLTDITTDHVRLALAGVVGDSTRDHVGVLLSMLFNRAVKAGHLARSPWSQGYTRKKRRVPVFDAEQLVRLVAAASQSVRPILALAAFCGMRKGEIFALRGGDVDLERRTVSIYAGRVVVAGDGGGDWLAGTKTGEVRVIPYPAEAEPFIADVVKATPPGELIFPKYREDLRRRLHVACDRIGVARVSVHDLRHICASNMMMAGGLAAAQAMVGHKNIRTTADVYGHLTSVYLAGLMDQKAWPDTSDLESELNALIEKLSTHPDPDVARLANRSARLLEIWHQMAPGQKNGHSENL